VAVVTVGGRPYTEAVREELEKLAAECPGRDFWHIPYSGRPDSWSSRPCGERIADITCFSPEAMREALHAAGGTEQ
jgi:hypothetical protein